jgi:YqaJ-like recombinase protein
MINPNRWKYIGGTDAPIIMGLKPFGNNITELWLEKVQKKLRSIKENAAMKLGKDLEPHIKKLLAQEDSKKLGLFESVTHDREHAIELMLQEKFVENSTHGIPMACHLDGYQQNLFEDTVIEIKTTSFANFFNRYSNDIPKYWVYQLMHNCIVLNTHKAKLIIFTQFDPNTILKDITRERQTQITEGAFIDITTYLSKKLMNHIKKHLYAQYMQGIEGGLFISPYYVIAEIHVIDFEFPQETLDILISKEIEFWQHVENNTPPAREENKYIEKEGDIDDYNVYQALLSVESKINEYKEIKQYWRDKIIKKYLPGSMVYSHIHGEKMFSISHQSRHSFDLERFKQERPEDFEAYKKKSETLTVRIIK